MIKVSFFGLSRDKFKSSSIETNAKNVSDLLKKLGIRFFVPYRELKKYVIFVNDVNINNLKMYRTKLNDGDNVLFMSPVSGG